MATPACSNDFSDDDVDTSSSDTDIGSQNQLDPMDVYTYRMILFPERCNGAASQQEDQDEEALGSTSSTRTGGSSPLRQLREKITRRSAKAWEALEMECQMIAHNVELQYTAAELRLRQDLAANKVRWHGAWRKDLWCFMRNNNPVASMCYSHPLHPVSRKQRYVAYFLQMMIVFYCSSALAEGEHCIRCDIRNCEKSANYVDCFLADQEFQNNAQTLAYMVQKYPMVTKNFCCTASRLGILWFLDSFGRYGGPLYSITANCIFTVLVFQMMMCVCVQEGDPRRRKVGEAIGYGVVAVIGLVIVSLAPLLVYYAVMRRTVKQLLINFVAGKLGSWTFVSLANVIGFHILWRKQDPSDDSTMRHFHVTEKEYIELVKQQPGLHPNFS